MGLRSWLLWEVITKLDLADLMVQGLQESQTQILKEIKEMATVLDQLKQEVTDLETVEESAIKLIEGLVAKLKDVVSETDLQQVIADLEKEKNNLAAAVAENTEAD